MTPQNSASNCPQTIPAAYDYATLVGMISTAKPEQVRHLNETWNAIGMTMRTIAEDLHALAAKSTAAWAGQAGQQARRALIELHSWTTKTGQGVLNMSSIISAQGEAAATALASILEPAPYDPVDWQRRIDQETDPFKRMMLIQQSYEQYHKFMAARSEAERAIMNYSATLRNTSTSIPTFAPPPVITPVNQEPPARPPGAPPSGGGTWRPPSGEVSPGEPSTKPAQPASTGTQGVLLDGRIVSNVRGEFNTPTTVGGDAGPPPPLISGDSGLGSTVRSPKPGNVVRSPEPGRSGRSSGSGRPVDDFVAGRAVRGSTAPSFSQNDERAAGAKKGTGGGAQERSRQGSGADGVGSKESAAARAAAKGRGAKSGAEFPSLPEAKPEEDGGDFEHQRPSYLIETEDIWGDNRWVPPPVIGEDPPDYYY